MIKLTATAIAVILVANSLFSFIMLQYLRHTWMGEVQTRAGHDLNAVRAAYGDHLTIRRRCSAARAGPHAGGGPETK